MAQSIELNCPAKINLNLKVLAKRQDGYHELDTVMCKLKLSDKLKIEISRQNSSDVLLVSPESQIKVDAAFRSHDNLMLRALNQFRQKLNWPQEAVKITINKQIPLGAGLGGGSSDCASILMALNSMAPSPMPQCQLAEMGLSLGADVPFFLYSEPIARATGIGEKLTHAPQEALTWRNKSLILINPGIFLSTAKIFQTLGLTNPPPNNNLGPMYASFVAGENDLLKPAMTLVPELEQIINACQAVKNATFGLSGSGPTFWLNCPATDELRHISAKNPSWCLWQTKIL